MLLQIPGFFCSAASQQATGLLLGTPAASLQKKQEKEKEIMKKRRACMRRCLSLCVYGC